MRLCLTLVLLALALSGCSRPEPIRIGFLGGLSGSVADLGEAGRNGALLAVEDANRAGGIDGRPLDLLVRDDAQNAESARAATQSLLDARVEVIVGPMTSAMATEVLPLAQQAGVVLLSPSATTTELSGKDDQFLRISSSTDEYAGAQAHQLATQLGIRRMSVLYDMRNRAYSESWLHSFTGAFERLGGKVPTQLAYESRQNFDADMLARELLRSQPECILLIASAVDVAKLAHAIRRLDPRVRLTTSVWGATEELVKLGGSAVEGMSAPQFFDRKSQSPAYLKFRRTYEERFQRPPGFAAVAAYDAASIAVDALRRRDDKQPLKQALLSLGPFKGLQHPIQFDANGDTRRPVTIAVIVSGQFVVGD